MDTPPNIEGDKQEVTPEEQNAVLDALRLFLYEKEILNHPIKVYSCGSPYERPAMAEMIPGSMFVYAYTVPVSNVAMGGRIELDQLFMSVGVVLPNNQLAVFSSGSECFALEDMVVSTEKDLPTCQGDKEACTDLITSLHPDVCSHMPEVLQNLLSRIEEEVPIVKVKMGGRPTTLDIATILYGGQHSDRILHVGLFVYSGNGEKHLNPTARKRRLLPFGFGKINPKPV